VVPGYTELQGIQSGTLDMATSWLGAYPNQLGVSAFFLGSSAGLLGSFGSIAWGQEPDVLSIIGSIAPGVKLFQNGISSTENWAVCREGLSLDTPADFQGKRYRAGGYFSQIITVLGASGQDIAQTELFSALERGVLDCSDVGPPHSNYTRFFHEIAPEWYTPGIQQQGYVGYGIFIREESWNALPLDIQQAIDGTMKGYAWDNAFLTLRDNMETWAMVVDEGLVNHHRLPVSTQQWIRDTIFKFFNDEVVGDALATQLWESQKAYDRKWTKYWNDTSQMSYESNYPITERPTPP